MDILYSTCLNTGAICSVILGHIYFISLFDTDLDLSFTQGKQHKCQADRKAPPCHNVGKRSSQISNGMYTAQNYKSETMTCGMKYAS